MRPESAATTCAVRHVLAGKSGVRKAAKIFGLARTTVQRAIKRRKKEAEERARFEARQMRLNFPRCVESEFAPNDAPVWIHETWGTK